MKKNDALAVEDQGELDPWKTIIHIIDNHFEYIAVGKIQVTEVKYKDLGSEKEGDGFTRTYGLYNLYYNKIIEHIEEYIGIATTPERAYIFINNLEEQLDMSVKLSPIGRFIDFFENEGNKLAEYGDDIANLYDGEKLAAMQEHTVTVLNNYFQEKYNMEITDDMLHTLTMDLTSIVNGLHIFFSEKRWEIKNKCLELTISDIQEKLSNDIIKNIPNNPVLAKQIKEYKGNSFPDHAFADAAIKAAKEKLEALKPLNSTQEFIHKRAVSEKQQALLIYYLEKAGILNLKENLPDVTAQARLICKLLGVSFTNVINTNVHKFRKYIDAEGDPKRIFTEDNLLFVKNALEELKQPKITADINERLEKIKNN